MPAINYLTFAPTHSSILINYSPAHKVQYFTATSQQQLTRLIESHVQNYDIYILRSTKNDQQGIESIKSEKQKEKYSDNQIEFKQADLLEEVSQECCNNQIQKANQLLQDMIKKTQAKVQVCKVQWAITKLDSDTKKYEQIRQKAKAKIKPTDKKQKKREKAIQKKLEVLHQQKQQLTKNRLDQSSISKQIIDSINFHTNQQQSSDSSLLCR